MHEARTKPKTKMPTKHEIAMVECGLYLIQLQAELARIQRELPEAGREHIHILVRRAMIKCEEARMVLREGMS